MYTNPYIDFSHHSPVYSKNHKVLIVIVAVVAIVAVFAITLGNQGFRTSTMVGEAYKILPTPSANLRCVYGNAQGNEFEQSFFCTTEDWTTCCRTLAPAEAVTFIQFWTEKTGWGHISGGPVKL